VQMILMKMILKFGGKMIFEIKNQKH